MRIKRLEIQGFKSFADRTVLNFGIGITGVVGPNGCGKSNVVDAIRWVMGEQSAKHLRGGSMQDVIFNGSDIRGPTGLAEVSLIFENDGRGFPSEYSNFTEIQVTRRLYRDGESDYEINKTPCRLRDITELFLGTGIGKQGFSIIEQGQVATIIKSKPEDRRKIIEEAAGITKYKARRQAAEKKMDATRQNLLRVSDVIREVNKRLGILKRQAKKAERYRELKANVRDLELHQSALRFFELRNALLFEHVLLQKVDLDKVSKETRLAVIETEIETARLSLVDDDKRLGIAQGRQYELDNQLALAEQQIAHSESTVSKGDERDREAREEIGGLEEALALIEAQKGDLSRGATDLEGDAAEKEAALAVAKAALDQITGHRTGEAKRIDELRREMMGAATRAAQAFATRESLDTRIVELDMRLTRVEEDKTRVIGENEAAKTLLDDTGRAVLEAEKNRAEKLAEKSEAAISLDIARRALAEQDKAILAEKSLLSERQSRLSSLQEIERSHERSPAGVRAMLSATEGKSGVRGLLADLMEVPETIEIPLASLLHERLQSVVIDEPEVALFALDGLRRESAGRASAFVDLGPAGGAAAVDLPGTTRMFDAVKTSDANRSVVERAIGDARLVDDGVDLVSLWRDARTSGITLVHPTGTVLEPSGIARGGAGDGDDAHILRQKRQIKELGEEVETLSAQHLVSLARRDELATALVDAEQRLERLTAEANDLELFVRDRAQARNRLQDDLVKMDRRVSDLVDELATMAKAKEKLAADLAHTIESLEKADAERIEKETALASLHDGIEQIDRELVERSEAVTRLKVAVAAAVERRENLRQSLAHHEKNESDITTRLERLREQVTSYAEEKARLVQQGIDARARIETLLRDRQELKTTLDATRGQYEEASQKVRELEAESREIRRSVEEVRQASGDLTLRIREHELDMRALHERTKEAHQVSPPEVLSDYHLLPLPDWDTKERVADLKKQIDGLGEINLTAIEECEELEERYEFLKTQSDDLTHALEQLEKAIVKINRTTRKRFKESFEQINAQFERVFPRLFRGGKAWLALTDPNDMLMTGVEIYAQPPGKKLGSVALMSGGEQALTAVSLIFAIFLIKPSPFCLLDEVDAPLDESNVGRFTDLVKDVSNISQFIVITHNKRTMEAADQLYGITMEQPGVSKAVNVRIH
jgi:chromosome segregation protein